MKRGKVVDRLLYFSKGGEGVSAAQPNNEPLLKSENDTWIKDEYYRSMDLEDLDKEHYLR